MNRVIAMLDDTPTDHGDEGAGFGALETECGRLPLVALDVKSRISGLAAEITVRQTFRNSLDQPLEATYIFPLPDRAAVTFFRMQVAGRTVDGELKERGEARQQYDEAIQQGHRASIAEEERSGVFNLRVGNIPAREEVVVELTLVGPLAVADGEATFRFPLVVAPRYTPGVPLDGPSVGAGVMPDTDQVPDASRVTPPVLLPGFPNPVQLSMVVELDPAGFDTVGRDWAQQIRGSLHSTITDDGPPWTVRLHPGERLNRDFLLRFPVADRAVTPTLQISPSVGGQPGTFALTLVPPVSSNAGRPRPRDVVFVLDRSGSMAGWKMVAARRALGRMIDTLLDVDRFTVLAFDHGVEHPPQTGQALVHGTNRERWRMVEWLGGVEARGGTEMGPALGAAAQILSRGDDAIRERILVLVTDGQVTGEDAVLRRLSRASGDNPPRIFTVGIDRAVNAGFLRRLADIGGGNCELVESEDRLDEAMDRIHRLVGSPALTQVRLEPVNFEWLEHSLAPARVPDLFVDRPITVFGRHLAGDTSAVRLRVHAVDSVGQSWQQEVTGRGGPAAMLASLWGRAKVRDLEDQYAAGQAREPEKLMRQIVTVSLESHVLSRFTAYVAVDRSEVVNGGGQRQQVVQPVEMPDGWATGPVSAYGPASFAFGSPFGKLARRRRMGAGESLGAALPRHAMSDEDECMDTAIRFCEEEAELDLGGALIDENSSLVLQLLQKMVSDARHLRATEIHIEPTAQHVRVSFLVKGRLVERDSLPLALLEPLVARVRQLAQFEAGDRDQPRQGPLKILVGSKAIKLQAAIVPGPHGESIVLSLPAPAKRKRFWT